MSEWPSDELLDEARRSLEPTARWRLFWVTKEGLDKANRDLKAWVASQRAKTPAEHEPTATDRGGQPEQGNADSERAEQAEPAGKRRRRLRARRPAGPEEFREIRAWAQERGLELSEHARLPRAILDQYRDAQQETLAE